MRRRSAAVTAALTSSPSPLLDVLVPAVRQQVGAAAAFRIHHAVASASSIPSNPSPKIHETSSILRRLLSSANNSLHSRTFSSIPHAPTPQVRTFSTTFSRPKTHILFNPQVGEDGQEMRLEITPRAGKRLTEIMKKDTNPHLALRIQVESGGCHGFQYVMRLVTLPPSLPTPESPAPSSDDTTATLHEDDTIFAWTPDESMAEPDITSPKIILDLASLELLKDSKVDFTQELIGSQFKIVDNPKATSSCGCGTSFDIKI